MNQMEKCNKLKTKTLVKKESETEEKKLIKEQVDYLTLMLMIMSTLSLKILVEEIKTIEMPENLKEFPVNLILMIEKMELVEEIKDLVKEELEKLTGEHIKMKEKNLQKVKIKKLKNKNLKKLF